MWLVLQQRGLDTDWLAIVDLGHWAGGGGERILLESRRASEMICQAVGFCGLQWSVNEARWNTPQFSHCLFDSSSHLSHLDSFSQHRN